MGHDGRSRRAEPAPRAVAADLARRGSPRVLRSEL